MVDYALSKRGIRNNMICSKCDSRFKFYERHESMMFYNILNKRKIYEKWICKNGHEIILNECANARSYQDIARRKLKIYSYSNYSNVFPKRLKVK